MRRKEMISLLEGVGTNVVYGWYEQGQEPERPYIVLNYLDSNDIAADNENYVKRERWQADLITNRRDEDTEDRLESALRAGGLFFYKTQEVDSADSYVRMIYRFQTIGG